MEGSSSRRELSTRSAVSLSILITCHRRDNCNTISKQLLYSWTGEFGDSFNLPDCSKVIGIEFVHATTNFSTTKSTCHSREHTYPINNMLCTCTKRRQRPLHAADVQECPLSQLCCHQADSQPGSDAPAAKKQDSEAWATCDTIKNGESWLTALTEGVHTSTRSLTCVCCKLEIDCSCIIIIIAN